MKARLQAWWKSLLALPLAAAFSVNSCTADAIRSVAEDLDEQADEIDGSRQDTDFGDWLADQTDWLGDEVRDW